MSDIQWRSFNSGTFMPYRKGENPDFYEHRKFFKSSVSISDMIKYLENVKNQVGDIPVLLVGSVGLNSTDNSIYHWDITVEEDAEKLPYLKIGSKQ